MPRTKCEVPMEQYTAMTLKEIAAKLGITPPGVYYIEQRALAKIALAIIALRRRKEANQ